MNSRSKSGGVPLFAAALLAVATLAAAQSLQTVPALKARVTDLTGTLTSAEQSALEEKLRAFEARNPGVLWRAGHPLLVAWFDRIAARPSFTATAPPGAAARPAAQPGT